LEKEDEEVFGFRFLEDDSIGHLVDYLELGRKGTEGFLRA